MKDHTLRTMETFADRLKKASAYARVEYSATEIGRNLGLVKQTVHRWMSGTAMPSPEYIFLIADSWRINPRWLATGEGSIFNADPSEGLTKQEVELVTAYRSAQPEGKNSMRAIAKAIGKGALAVFMGVSLQQPPAEACSILHNGFSEYTMIDRIMKLVTFILASVGIVKLTKV